MSPFCSGEKSHIDRSGKYLSIAGLNINLVCGSSWGIHCVYFFGMKWSHTGHSLPHRLTYSFHSGVPGASAAL